MAYPIMVVLISAESFHMIQSDSKRYLRQAVGLFGVNSQSYEFRRDCDQQTVDSVEINEALAKMWSPQITTSMSLGLYRISAGKGCLLFYI